MRSKSLALLLIGASLGLAACQGARKETGVPGIDRVLAVASDLDNPPFIGRDASGRPVGRDVEMMERIAAELGIAIEWREVAFEHVLRMVAAGEVDVGCATLGVTPARAEKVAFTRPYFHTSIAVVARAGEGEPRSFAALAGKRVGAAADTTSERAVRRLLPGSICVTDRKQDATTKQRLLSGELDAAAMDAPAADQLVAASAGALVRLRKDLDEEHYALAVPLGRRALLQRIDRILEAMESQGELAALDQRHGL